MADIQAPQEPCLTGAITVLGYIALKDAPVVPHAGDPLLTILIDRGCYRVPADP